MIMLPFQKRFSFLADFIHSSNPLFSVLFSYSCLYDPPLKLSDVRGPVALESHGYKK